MTPSRPHSATSDASDWVRRFISLLPPAGDVLDLAAGSGRHTELLLAHGHRVTALDRDTGPLARFAGDERVTILECDLESGGAWPLAGRTFAGVIVTNYLWRPGLKDIVANTGPGGLLIYETFAVGNERFGRPRNPAFLLRPGELLEAVAGNLRVLAYEDLVVVDPRPAALQRLCARRET
ncbi:MAG: class I SAM-dependent methyltransferase [bacterium]|nr:class I SAM-dependent methyltransferase [bacterium]MDE0417090.1 class I SAM-dependent methyltransferase [bacterium]